MHPLVVTDIRMPGADGFTVMREARALAPHTAVILLTIDDYAGWTLRRFLASNEFRWEARRRGQLANPVGGRAPTRYEAKARAAGRSSAYLTFPRQ